MQRSAVSSPAVDFDAVALRPAWVEIDLAAVRGNVAEAKRLAGNVVLLHRGRLIESTPAAQFFATPRTEEARKFIAGELLV